MNLFSAKDHTKRNALAEDCIVRPESLGNK